MDEQDLDELELPSKSQLKRDMLALQSLGEELVKLPKKVFVTMDLPEQLQDAVETARTITSHSAKKRQIKFISRILRSIDTDEVRTQLQYYNGRQRQASEQLHKVEQLRDQLISGGDKPLKEFIADYPAADHKMLRQLVRNTRNEQEQNKPGKSFRALFKLIRDIVEAKKSRL